MSTAAPAFSSERMSCRSYGRAEFVRGMLFPRENRNWHSSSLCGFKWSPVLVYRKTTLDRNSPGKPIYWVCEAQQRRLLCHAKWGKSLLFCPVAIKLYTQRVLLDQDLDMGLAFTLIRIVGKD